MLNPPTKSLLNAPTSCAMANAPVAQGASLDARLEEHESTMGVPYMAPKPRAPLDVVDELLVQATVSTMQAMVSTMRNPYYCRSD